MKGIALRPVCGRRVPRINARSSPRAHPAYIKYACGQQGSDRIHISSIPSMRPSASRRNCPTWPSRPFHFTNFAILTVLFCPTMTIPASSGCESTITSRPLRPKGDRRRCANRSVLSRLFGPETREIPSHRIRYYTRDMTLVSFQSFAVGSCEREPCRSQGFLLAFLGLKGRLVMVLRIL